MSNESEKLGSNSEGRHPYKKKFTIAVDFDGVLHSYKSGWKGARNIPDPVVPGAIPFLILALSHFEVVIHSSRSNAWFARRAMKKWLYCKAREYFVSEEFETLSYDEPEKMFVYSDSMDPFEVACDEAARHLVKSLKWPLYKPPALVMIDDRVIRFDGVFPDMDTLHLFQPWYKR